MSKDEYLITDPPLKALTVFAMPMILGSFFQQVYNMADSIIVGQFVGSSALAAVGACAALTNVFICVALGAGVGAGVLVSRYFGAKNYGKMKTIVSTSLISFLILSVVLGVFGFCFSRFMMSGLQTPADILEEAVLYLRVYFVGFPFLFMYNILSTMFTSIGESKIPLGLLIFSSILNIFMDLWMVAGLGLGVFGAALATLIAQGISAVFSFLIFLSRMRQYKSSFSRFDRQELYSTLRIAVPSVLQQSTVSIGMMIVQAVVNPFGTQALAGYAATMRVENVFSLIFVSIGNAVSPFVSQNLGAKKIERIKKGYHAALVLDLENGFFIENEAMILDEGKFYTVIKAGFGTNEKDACVCKTLPEYRFGAVLIKRRDAVLKQYLLKEEKRVEGILKGFAGKSEEELTAGQAAACKALKEELSCIREAQDEMQ